ncbi:MAG: DUF3822 family protein [Ferruginibacter sp.]
MKIAFKIPPAAHDLSDLHLLAEAGKDEISFLLYSKDPFVLQGFYTYSFNKHISDSETAAFIKEIIQKEPVLQQSFLSCNVVYNQKECTVIPGEYFSDGHKHHVCDLMFGEDRTAFCFTEDIKDADMKLVYRVPSKVHESLKEAFPSAAFSHAAAQQASPVKHTGNVLECIVYHNTVKMLLFKEGHFQLLQYAEYTVPADICYYLLNICRQFDVSPGPVKLLLSGMVDEDSNLYKEIYRYFLHVNLLQLNPGVGVADKLNVQPHHFYSHLSSLAQCV